VTFDANAANQAIRITDDALRAVQSISNQLRNNLPPETPIPRRISRLGRLDGKDVEHIDGDLTNNSIDNLRLVDPKENRRIK
jgi:hypothetical protein